MRSARRAVGAAGSEGNGAVAYRLGDLAWDVRKALSLPPGEGARRLGGRARRYVRRLANRWRSSHLTDADLLSLLIRPAPSLSALVARRRESEPLIPASARCAETACRLVAEAPGTTDPILVVARAVERGTFDLLGSGPVMLGRDPDWHADFKSGKRWDPRVYSLAMARSQDRGHDEKVPWEIARLQHLPVLGMASALTGEPVFRERAVAHIASFVAQNPVYRGINWSCAMDVAIRAAQILASEGFLRPAGDDRFWGDLLKSLVMHGRFVRANLEDGPVRGNHYVSNLSGLFLCGLGLAEFGEAAAWMEFGFEGLQSEMRRQVGADGLDYEASLSYHGLVTEMFLFPALVGAEKGIPLPRDYLDRLETMVEAVAAMIRPAGTLPQIGDNDDGRFLIFSQYHRHRRDWRPLLALGAYLFRRPEWLAAAGDAWVDGAWILGEPFVRWRASVGPASRPRRFSSRAFPEAGIYQLGGDDLQMVVDAGPIGQRDNGSHAHNDTLAFDLYALGREILPDRGTGAYTSDLLLRDQLRSTRAHNTIEVDGEEINPFPDEPFRLIPADAPQALRWRVGTRYAYLQAEHQGYRRLPGRVVHRRSILMRPEGARFEIEDRLYGEGRHCFVARYHLAPGWSVSLETDAWVARAGDEGPSLRCSIRRSPGALRLRVEECRHSPSYGVTLAATTVRIEWEGAVPCRLRYILSVQKA